MDKVQSHIYPSSRLKKNSGGDRRVAHGTPVDVPSITDRPPGDFYNIHRWPVGDRPGTGGSSVGHRSIPAQRKSSNIIEFFPEIER